MCHGALVENGDLENGKMSPKGGHQMCSTGLYKVEREGSAGGGWIPSRTRGIQWVVHETYIGSYMGHTPGHTWAIHRVVHGAYNEASPFGGKVHRAPHCLRTSGSWLKTVCVLGSMCVLRSQ